MNKGQTVIMLAAAWLLLILLLSGCGCGAPVWKAVPCTSEPADAEFTLLMTRALRSRADICWRPALR